MAQNNQHLVIMKNKFLIHSPVIFFLLLIGCDENKPTDTNGISNTNNSTVIVEANNFFKKTQIITLSENNINIDYFFKINFHNKVVEHKHCFLGVIIQSNGKILKVLNSVTYSGFNEDSKRASSSVSIFNENNIFIGMYEVGAIWSLPKKIEGDNIIFEYNDENCNQVSEINLRDSIPQRVFIPCTKEGGDIYIFSMENSDY